MDTLTTFQGRKFRVETVHAQSRVLQALRSGILDHLGSLRDQLQPADVVGCPCGRSQMSMQVAIQDLVNRANAESGTHFVTRDLEVTWHNGQPVVPSTDPFRPPSEGEVYEFHCAITDDDMRFRGEGAIGRALVDFLERRRPA